MDERASLGPSWRSLFHGCIREAVAAVNMVARLGTQETRAWERPLRYVADDNQGNVGVIEFQALGAVSAVSARASHWPLDFADAIPRLPAAWQREALTHLCDLPLLKEGQGVSAIFWTAGELIQVSRSWEVERQADFALFRREMLSDSEWETQGDAYYGLGRHVAELATSIAGRAAIQVPLVEITESELRLLISKDSEHEDEALDLLVSDGLFALRSS